MPLRCPWAHWVLLVPRVRPRQPSMAGQRLVVTRAPTRPLAGPPRQPWTWARRRPRPPRRQQQQSLLCSSVAPSERASALASGRYAAARCLMPSLFPARPLLPGWNEATASQLPPRRQQPKPSPSFPCPVSPSLTHRCLLPGPLRAYLVCRIGPLTSHGARPRMARRLAAGTARLAACGDETLFGDAGVCGLQARAERGPEQPQRGQGRRTAVAARHPAWRPASSDRDGPRARVGAHGAVVIV